MKGNVNLRERQDDQAQRPVVAPAQPNEDDVAGSPVREEAATTPLAISASATSSFTDAVVVAAEHTYLLAHIRRLDDLLAATHMSAEQIVEAMGPTERWSVLPGWDSLPVERRRWIPTEVAIYDEITFEQWLERRRARDERDRELARQRREREQQEREQRARQVQAQWLIDLGEAIRSFVRCAELLAMRDRMLAGHFHNDDERAIYRAAMSESGAEPSATACARLISRALPRKKLPNREVLVDVVAAVIAHRHRVRTRRRSTQSPFGDVHYAQDRLAREITGAMKRCHFHRSTSALEDVIVLCGRSPSISVERRSVVDGATRAGRIYASHREVTTSVSVPWRWMRVVHATMAGDPVVADGPQRRSLVLDLQPSTVPGIYRATVVTQGRGLGLKCEERSLDLREGRRRLYRGILRRTLPTGWDRLDDNVIDDGVPSGAPNLDGADKGSRSAWDRLDVDWSDDIEAGIAASGPDAELKSRTMNER